MYVCMIRSTWLACCARLSSDPIFIYRTLLSRSLQKITCTPPSHLQYSLRSSYLSYAKTQALYIISLVTWKLDESFVAGNILPSLKYIVDNERTAAVSMSVVGNYESIGNSLGLTYIASSVLPVLQVQSVLYSTILYVKCSI